VSTGRCVGFWNKNESVFEPRVIADGQSCSYTDDGAAVLEKKVLWEAFCQFYCYLFFFFSIGMNDFLQEVNQV
jgi:hypothetical protein